MDPGVRQAKTRFVEVGLRCLALKIWMNGQDFRQSCHVEPAPRPIVSLTTMQDCCSQIGSSIIDN